MRTITRPQPRPAAATRLVAALTDWFGRTRACEPSAPVVRIHIRTADGRKATLHLGEARAALLTDLLAETEPADTRRIA